MEVDAQIRMADVFGGPFDAGDGEPFDPRNRGHAEPIDALFAAVPFWIRGIDLRDATIVSAIVFPTVAAAFTYAIWREWNQ
jgi:hypothetical protein